VCSRLLSKPPIVTHATAEPHPCFANFRRSSPRFVSRKGAYFRASAYPGFEN